MSVEILGRREGQHLELKSRAALDEPTKIARAVVGMLNAGGGEVWIGVDDEDGVAVGVDAIRDPERARDRLNDSLLDTLDPSPTAEEVAIELVPPGTDPALLVVKVRPQAEGPGRAPYAFRKGGGWHFVRRVGARNHPMSRQEIFGRPAPEGGEPAVDEAVRKLEEARREIPGPGLWLALQPARGLQLDVQEERFVEIARDPWRTGNREAGSHFARSRNQPELSRIGIEWGVQGDLEGQFVSRVEVSEEGALHFWAALERLQWTSREPRQSEIWPLALLEYPISAFRIARVVYGDNLDSGDQVAADFALLGVEGWGLRKGTPGDFFPVNDLARQQEPDLIWEPVVFSYREMDEAPDRCGFRLVRRVYQAFGWHEKDIPRQYDRQTGKLILPE